MIEGVTILGIDPGFQNLGYALIECYSESLRPVGAGVFHTEKSDKKRKVLSVEDNLRRTKEIAKFLDDLIKKWKVKAICAEAMSFPRNSSAAAKVAMAWGVIGTLSELYRIPIIQATPQEVKIAMCGVKSASKEEVEQAVLAKFNVVGDMLAGIARSHREHAYDAFASALTGLKSDVMLALRGRL